MTRFGSRSGQTVVALAMMLAALIVLALVNADVFLAMRGKARLGNAGDAAALAAAYWQGRTLNMIGAINLARLNDVCEIVTHEKDLDRAQEVSDAYAALQERLAFAGPLMGLAAASTAAKRNHAPVDSDLTRLVDQAIARTALFESNPDGSWPTKWQDYAAMLRGVRGDGLAAGCDNAHLFDPAADFSDGHPLHNRDFYEAALGEDWCWFYLRSSMFGLLSNFTSWPALGETRTVDWANPEFFGVSVTRTHAAPIDWCGTNARDVLLDLADARGLEDVTPEALKDSGLLESSRYVWYLYDLSEWRAWSEMDPAGSDRLPILAAPKDEFNVFGAAAATRVRADIEVFTPGTDRRRLVWTAAAKPFGYREDAGGRESVLTFGGDSLPLVTPDFHAVRLIPLAGASESRLGTSDAEWVEHVRTHIPAYLEHHGTAASCSWCKALTLWDDASFRRKGVEWLAENSDQCIVTGGHGGPTGGTRHAH